MARLYLLLFLIQIVLAVIALIGCLSAEEDEIRALPRLVWALIILFFPLVGSIAWFLVGRPRPAGQPSGPWGALGVPTVKGRTRPVAPDDDPEFLRSLSEQQQSPQDRDLFERWEEDLRRREDDLRRGKGSGEQPREEERP